MVTTNLIRVISPESVLPLFCHFRPKIIWDGYIAILNHLWISYSLPDALGRAGVGLKIYNSCKDCYSIRLLPKTLISAILLENKCSNPWYIYRWKFGSHFYFLRVTKEGYSRLQVYEVHPTSIPVGTRGWALLRVNKHVKRSTSAVWRLALDPPGACVASGGNPKRFFVPVKKGDARGLDTRLKTRFLRGFRRLLRRRRTQSKSKVALHKPGIGCISYYSRILSIDWPLTKYYYLNKGTVLPSSCFPLPFFWKFPDLLWSLRND